MKNRSDLNQSYAAFDQASTIVCVVELSSKNWLAAATVPGVKRQPRKNLSCNPHGLLTQIERWRAEAVKAGHEIKRIVVAFDAGRDSLVRDQTRLVNRMKSMLVMLGITNFNIKLVKAGQKLAGLRTPNGEPIPPNTLAQLYRGLERLAVIRKQIKAIEQELRQRLKAKPTHGTNPLVLMLAKIFGLGLETANLLV